MMKSGRGSFVSHSLDVWPCTDIYKHCTGTNIARLRGCRRESCGKASQCECNIISE